MPNSGADATSVDKKLEFYGFLVTLAVGFVVVFCVTMTALMVYVALQSGKQSEAIKAVAIETHDSLCAIRLKEQKEQDGARKFLKDNPDGIPGIPAKLILDGMVDRQLTLDILNRLRDCSA